jgi:hypothetical protein
LYIAIYAKKGGFFTIPIAVFTKLRNNPKLWNNGNKKYGEI